jgi:hypothetical protein
MIVDDKKNNDDNKGKKVKVKLFLCFFNRAPRHGGVLGSGGIALRILELTTKWR